MAVLINLAIDEKPSRRYVFSGSRMQNCSKLIFGCDKRSLAAFRIGAAILIMIDAFVRYGAAESFYSGAGFFDASFSKSMSPDGYSLNYLSDSVGFQRSVFVALAFFAVLLGVGCFTRIATWGCWILLASIHIRNPMYVIGGDTILRMLLFWSLFVPLSSVWSVDQWRRGKNPRPSGQRQSSGKLICSVGTACLLLQVCVMYWTAGLSKWNEAWLSGSAMEYIFRQDCYTRPLSGWLLQYPSATSLLTYGTLVIELLVPLLVFMPFKAGQCRLALVAFFWSFHIGIDLTMDVGKFTYVSMVAWLPFLPSLFWDRFRWARIDSVPASGGALATADTEKTFHRCVRVFLTVVVPLVLFVYVLIWNVAGLYGGPGRTWQTSHPDRFYRFGNACMLKQNFLMFCVPARGNTTYLFSGRTKGGERVDLVRKQPASKTGPGASIPSAREWKTLHWYLISFGGDPKLYAALLDYHSEVWNRNAEGDRKITESRLERFFEDSGPGVSSGSFVHVRDLAEWRSEESEPVTNEQLKEDFNQLMDQLESGGLFPLDSN